MAEGMRDEQEGPSRASTVPAIITTNASSSSIIHHDLSTSASNSPTIFNRGDHSPSSPNPSFLRSSQSFPIGTSQSQLILVLLHDFFLCLPLSRPVALASHLLSTPSDRTRSIKFQL